MGFGVGRLFTVVGALDRARPVERHWHLAELGADPAVQRTGLGARLMSARLSTCDQTGTPAYLETPEKSIAYYRRFGFEISKPIPLPSAGLTVYGMWRPAHGH